MPATKLDAFTAAYVECALWSSLDDEGQPLDSLYSIDDISPATLAEMVADCESFQRDNADDIGDRAENAGHDFWLTRNGHGAGFWDRGIGFYRDGAGARLTDAAKIWGSVDLYLGDDGLLYA